MHAHLGLCCPHMASQLLSQVLHHILRVLIRISLPSTSNHNISLVEDKESINNFYNKNFGLSGTLDFYLSILLIFLLLCIYLLIFNRLMLRDMGVHITYSEKVMYSKFTLIGNAVPRLIYE